MKAIRVLQYIGSLNSGGSQSLIMNIYRNIERERIQFDFIVDRKDELLYKDEIEKLGGKVFVFDEYFRGKNYFSFIKQWEKFFVMHPEYHIIHCHVRSVASIVLRIAKSYNLVTICHSHSTSNGKGLASKGKQMLQRYIPRYSDYMLACSIDSAKWLYGERNASSPRCIILNNGVDRNLFKYTPMYRKNIRKEYGISNDNIVVGHVGRFEDVKNHRFILDCAFSLLKDNEKYIFMFCGDGSLKQKIIDEVRASNYARNFIFIDTTSDIYKYYNAFDLFILPSKFEGLGMVLIEAQFNGLFCIASSEVPDEAQISNNFVKKELNINTWKQVILNCNRARNIIKYNELADRYDIRNVSSIISNIYIECEGEYNETNK